MMRHSLLALLLSFLFFGSRAADAQAPYTIYPVPQEQKALSGRASFTPAVTVIAEAGVDSYTRDRLSQILKEYGLKADFAQKEQAGQSVIYLGINGSKGLADRQASAQRLKRDLFKLPKYDRHILSLSSRRGTARVVVLGEHTDAVFYGLATLEQMLDKGTTQLPCVTIYDYADVANRGIIEGYYGVPYSMEVTEDLFRFMARYKLNTYMYGAKSDPYHSQYWDKAYPEKLTPEQKRLGMMTADMMRHITEAAHQSKVNFVWAIHPGSEFTRLGESDVLDRIMGKFELMYDLGVRKFGVFVDDVGVPDDEPTLKIGASRLTELQALIDAKWNLPGAKPEEMVKPLEYVPQLYAYSWVKRDKARRFWESLRPVPEKVNIYTTGENVWSVPNSKDVLLLNDYLGKEVSWWWNYPCNDNDVTKIFIADTYTNFSDETHIDSEAMLETELPLKTIIINPMQQGELSKIALFSVGDYTWNRAAFDNMQSWKASLPAVVGEERAAALERLVPYLRYYDQGSELAGLINDFKEAYKKEGKAASATALDEALARIAEDCELLAQMAESKEASDTLFYADLKPWLNKLHAMATSSRLLLRELTGNPADRVSFAKSWSAAESIDLNEAHRFDILTGMGNDITLSVKTAEPAAKSLRPFLDWLLAELDK